MFEIIETGTAKYIQVRKLISEPAASFFEILNPIMRVTVLTSTLAEFQNFTNGNLGSSALIFISSFDHKHSDISVRKVIVQKSIKNSKIHFSRTAYKKKLGS